MERWTKADLRKSGVRLEIEGHLHNSKKATSIYKENQVFAAWTTLRCLIESLHQLGRILTEKPLAVHDAHVGMATAVQDVNRISHQQRESICCQQAQVVVIEQREKLKKRRGGPALTNRVGFNGGSECALTLSVSAEDRGWYRRSRALATWRQQQLWCFLCSS